MHEADLILWRQARLEAAVAKMTDGNQTQFGRMLEYRDGAFVRQMLNGHRAISEKVIRKIEALPGMAGWFDPEISDAASPLILEIRSELSAREVPAEVLNSLVQLLRSYPTKRKAA